MTRTRIPYNTAPEGFTPHNGSGPPETGKRVRIVPRRGSQRVMDASELARFTECPWTWTEGSTAAFDIIGWKDE